MRRASKSVIWLVSSGNESGRNSGLGKEQALLGGYADRYEIGLRAALRFIGWGRECTTTEEFRVPVPVGWPTILVKIQQRFFVYGDRDAT